MIFLPALLLACSNEDESKPESAKDTGADTGHADSGTETGSEAATGPDTGEYPSECGDAPCGGDPVGSWIISSACNEPTAELYRSCDEAVYFSGPVSVTGNIVIEGDGSVSHRELDIESTVYGWLPTSCLRGHTCEELRCAEAEGGCTCANSDGFVMQSWSAESWTASDTTLRVYQTDDPAEATDFEYCASEDQLTLTFELPRHFIRTTLVLSPGEI